MPESKTIGDMIKQSSNEIEEFGEAAEQFFQSLSEKIRGDFVAKLEQILSKDLVDFERNVNSFTNNSTSGAGLFSGLISGGLSSIFGNLIDGASEKEKGTPNLGAGIGVALGQAANTALYKAINDLARTGSIDLRSVIKAGSNAGSNTAISVFSRPSSQPGKYNGSKASKGSKLISELGRASRNR
jgi:hypothetical protein